MSNKNETILAASKQIESLITLELAMRTFRPRLFNTAFEKVPLIHKAGLQLYENVHEGDVVIIASGTVLSPPILGNGEMDGPPGATTLARAVSLGLGAIPLVIQEESEVVRQKRLMNSVGFAITKLDVAQKLVRMGRAPNQEKGRLLAIVEQFPTTDLEAKKATKEILSNIKPSAIICVEVRDRNEKGIYHDGAGGFDASEGTARIPILINEAKKNGILTIGIGDYGNEIGFGNIQEEVKKYAPWGKKCLCPCESGIAASTPVDILIPATVSNWGANAISTVLGMLVNKKSIIHTGKEDLFIINAAHNAGFLTTGFPYSGVDNLDKEIHYCVSELMKCIAENTLKTIN